LFVFVCVGNCGSAVSETVRGHCSRVKILNRRQMSVEASLLKRHATFRRSKICATLKNNLRQSRDNIGRHASRCALEDNNPVI
jgi:hypothetical protein